MWFMTMIDSVDAFALQYQRIPLQQLQHERRQSPLIQEVEADGSHEPPCGAPLPR